MAEATVTTYIAPDRPELGVIPAYEVFEDEETGELVCGYTGNGDHHTGIRVVPTPTDVLDKYQELARSQIRAFRREERYYRG